MAELQFDIEGPDNTTTSLADMKSQGMTVTPTIQTAPPEPNAALEFAKKAAIPTALQIGALAIPGGPAVVGGVKIGTLLLESGAGMLGETINQILGISEKSKEEI